MLMVKPPSFDQSHPSLRTNPGFRNVFPSIHLSSVGKQQLKNGIPILDLLPKGTQINQQGFQPHPLSICEPWCWDEFTYTYLGDWAGQMGKYPLMNKHSYGKWP